MKNAFRRIVFFLSHWWIQCIYECELIGIIIFWLSTVEPTVRRHSVSLFLSFFSICFDVKFTLWTVFFFLFISFYHSFRCDNINCGNLSTHSIPKSQHPNDWILDHCCNENEMFVFLRHPIFVFALDQCISNGKFKMIPLRN